MMYVMHGMVTVTSLARAVASPNVLAVDVLGVFPKAE
jgi:hypothetical protein